MWELAWRGRLGHGRGTALYVWIRLYRCMIFFNNGQIISNNWRMCTYFEPDWLPLCGNEACAYFCWETTFHAWWRNAQKSRDSLIFMVWWQYEKHQAFVLSLFLLCFHVSSRLPSNVTLRFWLLSILFLHFVMLTLLVLQVFSNVFTTGNSIRHIMASSGMDLGLYFILRAGEQQYVFAAGCE